MIDYLLSYADEATALTDLTGTSFVVSPEGGAMWNPSTVFPGLRLCTAVATYDAEGVPLTPDVLIDAQFWLLLSADESAPNEAITARAACQVAANREAALAGQPFIYQTGLRADPAQITSIVRIDGLPAGSAYPFGAVQIIP